MSNEYKDWLHDRACDVLLDAGLIDTIREICDSPIGEHKYVHGWKNGEKVVFAVWWNHIEKEWQYERRELDK